MKRWYVVQTQPGKERLAEGQLQNQQFATFCPLKRRIRRVGSRMRSTLDPFFPSYIFASFDVERQRWRSINGTIGVVRLVHFGASASDLPPPVPEGLVETFRDLTTSDGELRFAERLSPGDRVRILGGPLDTLCGVLEQADGKGRAMVLLDFLSRSTRVSVEENRLVTAC